jgi:hypothetical protein
MRTLSTAIDLDATPDSVWSILTATHDYPQWNPFIRRLDGPLTPGSQLTMRIEPPGGKGMTFTPKVTHVEPGRRLAWLGRLGIPGLFDGAHSFTLEPLDDRHTRLVQSESFTGILVWFSGGLLKKTEAGFHAMNAALQERLTATVGSSEH